MFFNTPDDQLRRMYKEMWGRDWPHDNNYLHELWLEAYECLPSQQEIALELMRENHDFTN
jgi:hypothetical protein